MNRRHWQILVLGALAVVMVLALGTKRLSPPVNGPSFQAAPACTSCR